MQGDPTLFTRRDEVEAQWRLITPILEAWSSGPPPSFPNYAAGSDGQRPHGIADAKRASLEDHARERGGLRWIRRLFGNAHLKSRSE